MPKLPSMHRTSPPAIPAVLAVLALGLSAPSPAHAHFILQQPPSSMSQDGLGSPQKLGPCGDEATSPPATPTGIVTTFQEGQTITVTVDGTIPHPGHWRVALGLTGPGDLPPEPAVTVGSTPCGSAAIESPPVFPVLADNLLPSTMGFTGVQSVQVTLPPGVTCTHCTLQVIQFMSDHPLNNPGGCFYHHCADISIVAADGGTASDAGTGSSGSGAGTGGAGGAPGTGGGSAGAPSSTSGCGCSVPASSSSALFGLAGLLGLATLVRWQRRRTPHE